MNRIAKTLLAACLASLAACLVLYARAASAEPSPVPVVQTRHLFTIPHLVLPSDLVIANNRLYIVDGGGHRVVVTDLGGKALFNIGKQGNGAGDFDGPVGIAADAAGRIVVCDSGNRRIEIFGPDGRFQSQFKVADTDGHPVRPIDAVYNTSRQSLYVSDGNNHKVLAYSLDGRLLFEWGRRGNLPEEFRYPATLAFSADRTLYVVDIMNTRVQRFSETGVGTVPVGDWGVVPGRFFRPKGVALDEAGRIYVSDSYLDVIQVFDGGRFLYALGDENGQPRRFNSPGGIAVSGRRIYVAEMFGRTVGVYELP